MKIAISGIHGFIGANLARYLGNRGHDIFGGEDQGTWKTEYDTGRTFDIRSKFEVEKVLLENEVDLLINLASRKGSEFCNQNVDDTYYSNITGTKNVIDVCNQYKIPLIHFGTTAYYYSNESKELITEETVIAPRTFYGWTKFGQVFMLNQMARMPYMIIEPVYLYGNICDYASNRSESVPDVIVRLSTGQENGPTEVRIDPKYIKDYTHISDFLKVFEKIILNPSWGERIMVGAGYNQTLYDVYYNKIKQLEDTEKLVFLRDTDYKMNQAHCYDKLYKLYPEAKEYCFIPLSEYFEANGDV